MINKAYIRELFNDTYVISGIQFMPFQPSVDLEVERIINIIGLAVFPACLAIALPVFIYNLVLEKETKLLETMKINGMKMKYYWLVNFSFFLGIYLITAIVFWLTAAFGFGMNFFVKTDWRLLALIYLGWGLCQVALSFFFSVFINNSQTASIIGYTMSIWACTIACTMNITVWCDPSKMEWFAYLLPNFPYMRSFHNMALNCAYSGCFKDISSIDEETYQCVIAMYVGALVYFVLALYLQEVVPQNFGVPKHPLFCLRPYLSKDISKTIFGESEE